MQHGDVFRLGKPLYMSTVDTDLFVDVGSLKWQAKGECAQPHSHVEPDDFFYEGRFPPNSKEQRAHIERLRNICAECLVFDECREFAESIHEGFWAGETSDERRKRLQVSMPPPATLVSTLKGLPLP